MRFNKVHIGSCVNRLPELKDESVDLVYLDPPFYTQRKHSLSSRDNKTFEFNDSWDSLEDYLSLIRSCLEECKRVLKSSGSIFLHCDKAASHHLRLELDKVFMPENFKSEIVWSYKRWSNSKKGLLNSHQNIYFYSKSKNFKFKMVYTDYALTTNLDQILQDRERSVHGKSVYKTDEEGNVVLGKAKKGVPLGDVWDIPYLNPKAKERVGYPTQKPVLLLKQIIELVTDEEDIVLDPFCGSGTTCVAAKSLNRQFVGIDASSDAVILAERRLEEMVITQSAVLEKGQKEYMVKSDSELGLLKSVNALPVQRNSGIDGFLREHSEGKPVPVKIQNEYESLEDAIEKLEKASHGKGYRLKLVIQTRPDKGGNRLFDFNSEVEVIKSLGLLAEEIRNNTAHNTV